ncbi:MAG: carboxynorspermidine decarboxylase [Bacteroides sp.]|nr:carboxynorspermidine decarboxylase [Ruminococcus flavefaciens]MCM1555729.1 carboxynorspermidine decarboxylase [Bacteroides sp.]
MKTKTELPLSQEIIAQLPNPCYVLDMDLLDRNLKVIRQVADSTGVEIILALKGFSMWSAFGRLRDHGFRQSTASSLWEARLALEEMGNPAYTYAVAYTDEEIEEIASLSSHITFNSISQFERFSDRARGVNACLSLGLRVNPEISSVGTDLYNPCVPGSRLGVRLCDLPAPEALPALMEGFHCHALCESDAEASCNLIDRFEERFAAYIPRLKWVNFGGGHLMTRQGYDTERLVARLKAFRQKWPHLKVILEPGAAFVWQTGYLLARVQDVVQNGGTPVAVMNVSFTAHMPDCLEQPYWPVVYGAEHVDSAQETAEGAFRYRLGGNSCLAGDFMGDWIFGKPVQPGDLLLFNDMIHYTFVKTTTFNGVHHPSLCMVRGNELLYRRDFGYQDFKGRLS